MVDKTNTGPRKFVGYIQDPESGQKEYCIYDLSNTTLERCETLQLVGQIISSRFKIGYREAVTYKSPDLGKFLILSPKERRAFEKTIRDSL